MLAINQLTALKMFWDAGFKTEDRLRSANAKLETLAQPAPGYFMANDVSAAIDAMHKAANH